jgi:hypothetical protein
MTSSEIDRTLTQARLDDYMISGESLSFLLLNPPTMACLSTEGRMASIQTELKT